VLVPLFLVILLMGVFIRLHGLIIMGEVEYGFQVVYFRLGVKVCPFKLKDKNYLM